MQSNTQQTHANEGRSPDVGSGDGLGGWDEVIEAGPDKGKTVAQLHDEVFNPAVSDLDYFLSRCCHHGIKPPNIQ